MVLFVSILKYTNIYLSQKRGKIIYLLLFRVKFRHLYTMHTHPLLYNVLLFRGCWNSEEGVITTEVGVPLSDSFISISPR